MNNYTLKIEGWESNFRTVYEAADALRETYPYAYFGELQGSRILAWEDEESSENDDGQKAVAVIQVNNLEHYEQTLREIDEQAKK